MNNCDLVNIFQKLTVSKLEKSVFSPVRAISPGTSLGDRIIEIARTHRRSLRDPLLEANAHWLLHRHNVVEEAQSSPGIIRRTQRTATKPVDLSQKCYTENIHDSISNW